MFSDAPTPAVKEAFAYCETLHAQLVGSGDGGQPRHDESQELMFQVCTEFGWWDWRKNKGGLLAFPYLKLVWKKKKPKFMRPPLLVQLKAQDSG